MNITFPVIIIFTATVLMVTLLQVRSEIKSEAPFQIVADEVCIDYQCREKTVTISMANDSVLSIYNEDKTFDILVEKVVIVRGHYFIHFELKRGFLTVAPNNKNAFMYLDKREVVFHIKSSSLNQ